MTRRWWPRRCDCIDDADEDGQRPSTLGKLPLGPRPSAGPGEPGTAGPGLGRWGGTRRRAVHQTWTPPSARLSWPRRGRDTTAYRQAHLAVAAGTGAC